jgi:hypothetical protein
LRRSGRLASAMGGKAGSLHRSYAACDGLGGFLIIPGPNEVVDAHP